jgi:hypothetical protein
MSDRNSARSRAASQGHSNYQPKAHQLFRRARDWQFAAGAIGHRKWRTIQARLKMLTRALATFDRSGACIAIYPATRTILKRVRELEEKHAAHTGEKLRTWSRAGLFRYLALLDQAGIETKTGSAYDRTPRRRTLNPQALLSVPVARPRECETRGRVECETRGAANVRPKKSLGELQTSAPSNVLEPVLQGITESQSSSESEVSTATPDDDDSLTRLRAKAEEILIPEYNENLVELALDRIEERIAEKNISIGSHNYFVKAFQNLLSNEREYIEVYDDFSHRMRLRDKWNFSLKVSEYTKTPDRDKTNFVTWLRGDSAIVMSEHDLKRWTDSAVPPPEVLDAYARGEIDSEQAGLHNYYSCEVDDCAQCRARLEACDRFEGGDEHIEF